MKILWITNIVFPEAVRLINKKTELKSSGGWMLGSAEEMGKDEQIELTVATPTPLVNELLYLKGVKISYCLFPMGRGNIKYNKDYEYYWREIKKSVLPDVVHIHGTEYTHGLAYVKACGNEKVVVSIQGLVSVIADYYNCGLSSLDIVKSLTLRDLLKGTLFHEKKEFRRRGRLEVELLQSVDHVIGRTSWDKAHAWAINPHAHYHFCNETLRPEFYKGETWEYKKCVPYSIFLSQANYPIKGFHQILKAMPLILRDYPDAMIRIAGQDIFCLRKYKGLISLQSGYSKYISKLVECLKLKNHIVFLGRLNAEEMKQEYLKCNVFVCPSSIENSPNSIGEAQILGVPIVASYAGGIPDMMKGNEDNLYRFNDYEMLAQKVCSIFHSKTNQKNMKQIALNRHDKKCNRTTLSEIYHSIMSL